MHTTAINYTRETGMVLFWGFVLGTSLYFFADNVIAIFFGYVPAAWGETFLGSQLWVILHLVGGTLALLLGPFQFWKRLRVKYLSTHRLLGKLYVIGAALTGMSALRLSLISNCVPCRLSLFLLAVLALLATWFAWRTIRAKNVKAHRQFMIRSYVLIFSFVAVRLDYLFGVIEDESFSRTVQEYFFSFFPLICTEILITWIPAVSVRKQVSVVPSRK
jgi:uncharacterized membrane protein